MNRQLRLPILSQIFLIVGWLICFSLQAQENKEWVVYEGSKGPGVGKHIVFVSGDEEYRSEEALPALAKILAFRHGFKCTVLFSINPDTGEIDPDYQNNIPGLKALQEADLMVMLLRFRALPSTQMKFILDYLNAGKPVIGLRTSTHAFLYPDDSPYAKYGAESDVKDWEGGFGRQVLGETWVSHHGEHGSESTQGLINGLVQDHPILRSVADVWGPTDVYGINDITGDETTLLFGQSLLGMKPGSLPNFKKSILPIAWIKHYTSGSGNTSKIFTSTMGAAVDMENVGFRRLLINAAYWCMDMEVSHMNDVRFVGTFKPTFFGFGKAQKGLKPDHFSIDKDTIEKYLNESRISPQHQ